MICPNCGLDFTPHHNRQLFCCDAHKRAFHKLMEKRGQVLLPLVLAAREAGRYAGTDKALGAYARKTADDLLSAWVIEDRACGRSAAVLAANKHVKDWKAADLTFKADRLAALKACPPAHPSARAARAMRSGR